MLSYHKELLQQNELLFDQREKNSQQYGLAFHWVFPWHTDGKWMTPTCVYAAKVYRGAHDKGLWHSQHGIAWVPRSALPLGLAVHAPLCIQLLPQIRLLPWEILGSSAVTHLRLGECLREWGLGMNQCPPEHIWLKHLSLPQTDKVDVYGQGIELPCLHLWRLWHLWSPRRYG